MGVAQDMGFTPGAGPALWSWSLLSAPGSGAGSRASWDPGLFTCRALSPASQLWPKVEEGRASTLLRVRTLTSRWAGWVSYTALPLEPDASQCRDNLLGPVVPRLPPGPYLYLQPA